MRFARSLQASGYHPRDKMAISLPKTEERTHSRLLAGLLLLAALVYANTLFLSFVYDDNRQILENPYVHSFRYVEEIFTKTVWAFQGQEKVTSYYRPLMTFTYLLCHTVFGSLPIGYHLVNVLLNVVVVYLVYAVGARLFRDATRGLIAGAVFALHPVHTEAVAWIASLPDLQLAVFYLMAFFFFLQLEETEGGQAAKLQAGMLACFFLAVLSKEPSATLPVAATVYEHFCRSDRAQTTLKTKMGRYAGLWLIVAAYIVFRVTVLGGVAVVVKHPDVTWPLVPLSALALTAQYVEKLFWPWPLSVTYPFEKSTSLGDPRVLAGLAVLAAAVALLIYLAKRSRPYAFALFWMFLTLGPVLNARWMATNVFAERYLYLPSVGFAWLVAGGILWLWQREGVALRLRRASLAVLCAGLALLAAGVTVARNRDWKDDRTLDEATLAFHPHESFFRTDLGAYHWNRGNRAEAERQWRRALEDNPENQFALSNMGMALLEQKRYGEAIAYLEKVIALRPRFAAPRIHLARVHMAQGRKEEAEVEFRRAIEFYPLSTNARNTFGRFLLEEGRLNEAAVQFRASVESIPTEDGWAGLAEVYTRQNNASQAEVAWREVVQLNPFDSRARFALGKLYLASGRFAEARKELEAGLLIDPENAEALAALAKLATQTKP
jgi:Tfp pilus assembly protein PilF